MIARVESFSGSTSSQEIDEEFSPSTKKCDRAATTVLLGPLVPLMQRPVSPLQKEELDSDNEKLIEWVIDEAKETWTEEEDEKLMEWVLAHPEQERSLEKIEDLFDNHDMTGCLIRWHYDLKPGLVKITKINRFPARLWNRENDRKLLNLAIRTQNAWRTISLRFEHFDPSQCKHRYDFLTKPGLNQGRRFTKWTDKEDESLKLLVQEHRHNWQKVAAFLPGHTQGECRSRYRYQFEPYSTQKKRLINWTEEEEAKLMQLAKEYDRRWTKIAPFFPRFTAQQLNSHYKLLKKEPGFQPQRKNYWTKEATKKLWHMKTDLNASWEAITKELPNYSPAQCKDKYFFERRRRKRSFID